MRVVRKSLARKLWFILAFFALLLLVLFYLLDLFNTSTKLSYLVLGSFVLVAVFSGLFYYLNVVRPLKKVIVEMQSLLLGQPYKEVMSYRMDEIGVVAYFFNQVTKSLGKISSDLKEHERMIDELSVAAQVQREILPLENPQIKGLNIVVKNKPMSELGGDSFNFFKNRSRAFIYIGDVTGHGASAALVTTVANTLLGVFASMHQSPYHVLVEVNKYIKDYIKRAMFMTLVLLSYEYDSGKLSYAGAGHENILVYRKAYAECDVLPVGGVALGMVPDNSNLIKEISIDWEDGDFVILYSDGIIDSKNKNGEFYGLERLRAVIKEYAPDYSADGLNYQIARDVANFVDSADQVDDMTLIVIQKDMKSQFGDENNDKSTSWLDTFV